MPAIAQGARIKLGYVSPQSGPLAAFAEADSFILSNFGATAAAANFEIIVKDSQSNPNRAAEVAKELIIDDEVDMLLVASTPETTNPVATTAEAEGVPVISTVAPWQPWFIGQQGNPGAPDSWQPFDYAYHFFWGLEDVISVFTAMWGQLDTNKQVGGLFPNDGDGNAWGDPNVGFPPVLDARLRPCRPGPLPEPDRRFLGTDKRLQAGQCGDRHRRADPAGFHHLLEPGQAAGFQSQGRVHRQGDPVPPGRRGAGRRRHNLSSEVWWSPSHPFSSSLNGLSAGEVAAAYTQATGKQWTQPIGFVHALFELATNVMGRVSDAGDGDAVAEAIAASNLQTIVGPIAFDGKGLPPFAARNICKTPLVGGQWRLKDGGGYDLVIVDNSDQPSIPTGGTMQPIS
jgi:branched-chain amino acid transport system substrate-binding protein